MAKTKQPTKPADTQSPITIDKPVSLDANGYGALPFVPHDATHENGPWISPAQVDAVTERLTAAGFEVNVMGLRAYCATFASTDDGAADLLEHFASTGATNAWAPTENGLAGQGWTLCAVLRDDPGALEDDAVAIMARMPSAETHAATFLVGNLMQAVGKRYQGLAVPFSQLSEIEQSTLKRNVADDVRRAVDTAIKAIASNQRLTFRAEVAKVEFKGSSDITATLKLASGLESHALADSAGGYVTLVIESVDELLQITDADTKGEPDQKPLFDASAERVPA